MLSRAAGRNILVFWYHISCMGLHIFNVYNDNVDTKVKRSVDVGVMLFYYHYCPIVTPITDNEPPQAAGEWQTLGLWLLSFVLSTIINYLDPEISREVKLDSFPPPPLLQSAAATTPWTLKITAEYWNLVYGWKYIFEENTGEALFQPIILFIILRQHTA